MRKPATEAARGRRGWTSEATEDITIELLTVDEVRTLLTTNQIKQSLMAAPLWKYFAVNRLL